MNEFRRYETCWTKRLGDVDLTLMALKGEVQPIQLTLAELIGRDVPAFAQIGSDYLEQFIDRSKVCLGPPENWFLHGIVVEQVLPGKAPTYLLDYSLFDDGDGMWTVAVSNYDLSDHPLEKGQRPFLLQRVQG